MTATFTPTARRQLAQLTNLNFTQAYVAANPSFAGLTKDQAEHRYNRSLLMVHTASSHPAVGVFTMADRLVKGALATAELKRSIEQLAGSKIGSDNLNPILDGVYTVSAA